MDTFLGTCTQDSKEKPPNLLSLLGILFMMYCRINELLKENFHTLQPADSCVTEEAPDINIEDVTNTLPAHTCWGSNR